MLRGFIGSLLPQVLLFLLLGVAFLVLAVVLIELVLLLLQIEVIVLLLPAGRVLAVADRAVAGVVGVAVPLVQLRVPQALVLKVLAQLGAALAQLGRRGVAAAPRGAAGPRGNKDRAPVGPCRRLACPAPPQSPRVPARRVGGRGSTGLRVPGAEGTDPGDSMGLTFPPTPGLGTRGTWGPASVPSAHPCRGGDRQHPQPGPASCVCQTPCPQPADPSPNLDPDSPALPGDLPGTPSPGTPPQPHCSP